MIRYGIIKKSYYIFSVSESMHFHNMIAQITLGIRLLTMQCRRDGKGYSKSVVAFEEVCELVRPMRYKNNDNCKGIRPPFLKVCTLCISKNRTSFTLT